MPKAGHGRGWNRLSLVGPIYAGALQIVIDRHGIFKAQLNGSKMV
jgi:hypothetical protein